MSRGWQYDRVSNSFKKVTRSLGQVLGSVLRYTLLILGLTTVLYVVFALLVSTDEEKALLRENRLYRQLYPELEARGEMLSGAVEGLQVRDNGIYESLFAADAPSVSPVSAADFISRSDTLSEQFFLSYSSSKVKNIARMAVSVEENFQEVMRLLEERKASELPPLSLPLQEMDYTQTGASVGKKVNPLLQIEAEHEGIDLIARQGEAVYATAAGTVQDVVRGSKSRGNVVILDHGNGYQSRYCFLTGVTVSRGQKLGAVGIARGSYAPHLHYELSRDGKVLDPVHYFLADVTPQDYARMMYFAATSMQSMD